MEEVLSKKKVVPPLILGIIGCILMGGSDWLMIYGDTHFKGNLAWLTEGVAAIPSWRNALAMVLAIPAVVLYAYALLKISNFITEDKSKNTYSFLTTIGLTPWLCLHLLYTMILYLFSFLIKNEFHDVAFKVCEELFNHFVFLVPLSEVLMLLPFIYLFITIIKGSTIFKKAMCINNPLIIYVVLKLITLAMPDTAFRLAFTNGLMSEAMLVFFIIYIIFYCKNQKSKA